MAAAGKAPAHCGARAILLFPALLIGETRDALASAAGRATEIVHVTSRENRIFDLINELLISACLHRSVATQPARREGQWVDLPIDCADTPLHLRRLGFQTAPPQRRICHWSSYMRPGVFDLYRALLAGMRPLPLCALIPPEGQQQGDARRVSAGAQIRGLLWPAPRA